MDEKPSGTVNLLALREQWIAARSKADEAIKAIDLVLSMTSPDAMKQSAPTIQIPEATKATYFPASSIPERIPEGLTEAVRKAIKNLELVQDEFTVRDIEGVIKKSNFPLPEVEPRTRISMVLKKLESRGEIEVIEKGSGRTPSRYKVSEL